MSGWHFGREDIAPVGTVSVRYMVDCMKAYASVGDLPTDGSAGRMTILRCCGGVVGKHQWDAVMAAYRALCDGWPKEGGAA